MESAEHQGDRESLAGPVETLERLPLPPAPPPIRAVRLTQGPPPPPTGSTANPAWRSPQASANPVRALGPSGQLKSTSKTTRNVVIALAVVLLAGFVASAFIFAQAFGNTTLVASLETGDCLADFFETGADGEYIEVFLVDTPPCAEPHAMEVYAHTDLLWSESTYPGVDEAFRIGEDWCFDQYDVFIGGDYAVSDYEVWTFVPQEQGWNSGDRTVQCLVGHYDEMTLVTGTLEGADRQIQ